MNASLQMGLNIITVRWGSISDVQERRSDIKKHVDVSIQLKCMQFFLWV